MKKLIIGIANFVLDVGTVAIFIIIAILSDIVYAVLASVSISLAFTVSVAMFML